VTQVPEPPNGLESALDRLVDAASTPQLSGSGSLPRLEALLALAAAPAVGPQPGEQQALAAFRELVTEQAGTPSLAARRRRQVTVAAIASTVVVLGSGMAAAAGGSLPGAAQTTAKTVLGAVGVHVPGPNTHAGTHPHSRVSSDQVSEPTPPRATPPVTPAVTPGAVATPPAPGNSAAARHHGQPAPTAHPRPHHGHPSAAPTVARRHSLPATARANPTPTAPRVMRGAARAITR
jgi:hypothetical protein